MEEKEVRLDEIPELIKQGKIKKINIDLQNGSFEISGRISLEEEAPKKQLLTEQTT